MDQPGHLTAKEGAAETPLHAACWAGDLAEVKRLVGDGANVNHLDSAGESPLHGAAAWGHTDVVRFLVSSGAAVNVPGTTDLSRLHWAAGWGNVETVRVLVEAGADVRAKNQFGETPCDIAVSKRKVEATAYLRSHDG